MNDNSPLNENSPLFVPEEFEREHLAAARRRVAESRGSRRLLRRTSHGIGSLAVPAGARPLHRFLGVACLLHGPAAVLILAVTVITQAWLVGLALLLLLVVTLGALLFTIRRIRSQDRRGPPGRESDAPRR